MSTTMKNRAALVGWAAITALAVFYAPMAIEYTWRLFHPGSPELWNHAYAGIVDHDEAYGSGSIHAVEATRYADNRWTLLFHTTTGGVAILLFAAQFSSRLRRNLRRHRILGRVALSVALIGMLGAMVYLLAVGPHGTFDGPAFHLQLWALAIGTTIAIVLGFAAVRQRQIAMHQALMAYAFALLLTAPLLRVAYLVLGSAWPDSTQLETNLAGAAFLATWAPFGAFLAARGMDHTERRSAGIRPLPGRRLDIAMAVTAAVATAGLGASYRSAFGSLDRVTTTSIVALVAAVAVASTNLLAARRLGRPAAADEWRTMLLALAAAPLATLILWQVYAISFSDADAFGGALLTGPAVPVSLGFLVVTWRRRRVRRPEPTTDWDFHPPTDEVAAPV
ncbi:DUF2306 domain-containing protein [Nocardioides humilatus]|uniref:DUF2306 domain-containing protein n=1 Tax=Nocardioides humilatus TaxID=2607660 RepID=UPI00165F29EB|nr:DUF2306 domain-containing protein [Nocardioides humilatus]